MATSRKFSLGVVILAAGRSARMGRPKLLLPWGQTSVLGHLIEQWRALGAKQIAVVCTPGNPERGHSCPQQHPGGTANCPANLLDPLKRTADRNVRAPAGWQSRDTPIQAELNRLGFPAHDRIINPAPQRGMFSSIQCAAQWPGWDASLTHWAIVLGDQPHLSPETLRRVLAFSAMHPRKVCQPAREGHGRHPVLLPKSAFQQLAASTSRTLKSFLAARPRLLALCELDDPGLDLDIDRPGDYSKALLFGYSHAEPEASARTGARRKGKPASPPASVLPRLRVMCGRDAALGPGRIQLLELVGETGSLRSAAARMGMAYMTAWMHVKALNRRFRSPVVVSTRGGQTGGGAVLTKMGQRVVALYHHMEAQSHAAIQKGFREFQTLLRR